MTITTKTKRARRTRRWSLSGSKQRPSPGEGRCRPHGDCRTDHDHGPHATNTGISNNKLAMWLFLSRMPAVRRTDLDLPAVQERQAIGENARPDRDLRHPVHVGRRSSCLMSSLTMVLASLGHCRGDTGPAKAWLLTTACSVRCSSPARSTSSPSSIGKALATPRTSSRRPSYTLTGFHGVHVSVGIIMLLTIGIMHNRQVP